MDDLNTIAVAAAVADEEEDDDNGYEDYEDEDDEYEDDNLYPPQYDPNDDDEEGYKEEFLEDIDEGYNYHYEDDDKKEIFLYYDSEYLNEDDINNGDFDELKYCIEDGDNIQRRFSDDVFDDYLQDHFDDDDNYNIVAKQIKEALKTISNKDYEGKIDTQTIKAINNFGLDNHDIIFQRNNLVTIALNTEDYIFVDKSNGLDSMRQLIHDFDKNDYDYKDEDYRLKESIVIDFEATKANLGSEGIDMLNKLQDEMDNDLDDEANDDIEYFKEHIEKSIELLEELEDTHKLLYAYGYKSMFHTLDQQGKDWINKIHELCESDETDCDELENLLETIDLYIDRFENYEDDQVQVIFELSNAVKNFEEFLEDIVILQNYNDITEIPQYEFYKSLLETAQEIIEEEGDSGEYTTLPDFKATALKNLREAAMH